MLHVALQVNDPQGRNKNEGTVTLTLQVCLYTFIFSFVCTAGSMLQRSHIFKLKSTDYNIYLWSKKSPNRITIKQRIITMHLMNDIFSE